MCSEVEDTMKKWVATASTPESCLHLISVHSNDGSHLIGLQLKDVSLRENHHGKVIVISELSFITGKNQWLTRGRNVFRGCTENMM